MMPMRRVRAAVAAAVVGGMVIVVSVGPALAHTDLESAEPAPGATVDDLQEISLTFSGALAGDGDHEIGLFDGDARLETGPTEMLDERTIAVDVLGPVPASELTVRWVIVAGDGDEQRGDYSVTLTEPAEGNLPVPEESAVSSSPLPTGTSPAPSTPATDATSDGVSGPPAGRVDPTGPNDDESGPASPVALAVAGVGAVAIAGAAMVAVRRRG